MGAEDKARNAAEKAKGKMKEAVGRTSRDRDLEAEGHVDQTKGDLKQAGEKAKDAFRHD